MDLAGGGGVLLERGLYFKMYSNFRKYNIAITK
jgi:hypothetical protein